MAITSTEPVRNSQSIAAMGAQLLIPWVMALVVYLSTRWGVPITPDYQIQLTIGLTSVLSMVAGEWARRQVEAPKLLSNGDMAAFKAWQKLRAGELPPVPPVGGD